MAGFAVDNLVSAIIDACTRAVLAALTTLWDLLSATVFQSPDVTRLPQVAAFARTSLDVVNACYVLAFVWVAALILGRDTIQSRYGPGELIPRLIIGLIGANFALPVCSTLIDVANAVTAAVTGQDITAAGSMQQLRATTLAALTNTDGPGPTGLLMLLVAVLIAVLVATLVGQWIVRLGVLIVAAAIAPIALALHGTPQTDGAAKLWWRTILGALGAVILQAFALHTTLTILLDPNANLQLLGLPGEPGATMNLLIVACLLWGIIRIPGLMRRYVTQTRPNAMGTILRVVLVQQLTRRVSRFLRPGRTAGGRPTGVHPHRQLPPPTGAGPGRGGTAHPTSRPARTPAGIPPGGPAHQRLPPPAGAGPGRVAVAYPTGRPIRPYTRDELAAGVDVYTRALRRDTRRPNL